MADEKATRNRVPLNIVVLEVEPEDFMYREVANGLTTIRAAKDMILDAEDGPCKAGKKYVIMTQYGGEIAVHDETTVKRSMAFTNGAPGAEV